MHDFPDLHDPKIHNAMIHPTTRFSFTTHHPLPGTFHPAVPTHGLPTENVGHTVSKDFSSTQNGKSKKLIFQFVMPLTYSNTRSHKLDWLANETERKFDPDQARR